ncbi:hypothetical protein Leryth_014514 [Lithospermum erythrorhizon]|nr:hypothetical protein Leryth_014514 [Lithospermum erythrorhizon]
MDTEPEEAEKCLLHEKSPSSRKGGFRTMPFIIVNESFEKVASYGLAPNMIIYLMNDYHLDAATGSSIIYLWSALSNCLSIFGAVSADSYLGRFSVIAFGSISSLLGMMLLWLTAAFPQLRPTLCDQPSYSCNSPQVAQLAVLFLSFVLISVGAGCVRPCSIAFGADQLAFISTSNKERVLDSYFNWYYASAAFSSIVAMTVIVYIQDSFGWTIGFAVPVILMTMSVPIFLLGSSLYIKVKPRESLFAGFMQVLVAAFRKRNICHQIRNSGFNYYSKGKSMMLAPSNDWRFFNNACIIEDPDRDLNPDGSASNPWRLCNVELVESLKSFIRVLPMWSSGIVFLVSLNSLSFTVLQAQTMDRHVFANVEIPAGSFGVFLVVSLTLWIGFYNCVLVPLLRKYTTQQNGLSPILRMGIGLVIGTIAMTSYAIIESRRRWLAIETSLQDDANDVIEMSALWLVPQEVLLGLAEAFNAIGQIEFFYTQFPRSMSSIAVALYSLEAAISNLVGSALVNIVDNVTEKIDGISWLSSNINNGHLDYYCWLLTLFNVVNFVYFLGCYRSYRTYQKIGQSNGTEENDHVCM